MFLFVTQNLRHGLEHIVLIFQNVSKMFCLIPDNQSLEKNLVKIKDFIKPEGFSSLTNRGIFSAALMENRLIVERSVANPMATDPHARFLFTSRTNRGEMT